MRPSRCSAALVSLWSWAATRSVGGLRLRSPWLDRRRRYPARTPKGCGLPRMRCSVLSGADNRTFRCGRPADKSEVAAAATERVLSAPGHCAAPSRLCVRLRLRPPLGCFAATAPASLPGRIVPPLRGWCRPSGAVPAPRLSEARDVPFPCSTPLPSSMTARPVRPLHHYARRLHGRTEDRQRSPADPPRLLNMSSKGIGAGLQEALTHDRLDLARTTSYYVHVTVWSPGGPLCCCPIRRHRSGT